MRDKNRWDQQKHKRFLDLYVLCSENNIYSNIKYTYLEDDPQVVFEFTDDFDNEYSYHLDCSFSNRQVYFHIVKIINVTIEQRKEKEDKIKINFKNDCDLFVNIMETLTDVQKELLKDYFERNYRYLYSEIENRHL